MKNRHPIHKNLIGIEKIKSVVNLNKPIYVGMAILEHSNYTCVDYYDVLRPIYGERIKLAYTDTDSFVIHIETEDHYNNKLIVIWMFVIIQKPIAITITLIRKFLENSKMKSMVTLYLNS